MARRGLWRRPRVGEIGRRLLPDDLVARIRRLQFDDRGHGFDAFGLNPDWVAFATAMFSPVYTHWFRVSSYGTENIHFDGGAVLACNHSGTIPLDAMMLWQDVVRHSEPPRVPRAVLDHFVNLLPFISVLYTRGGAIGGNRGNCHTILESGQWLMVFPEGVPGIGKPFRDRYKLQPWREGHAELAIRHRVPVIPVGLVGAEEQMPQLGRLPIHVFGAPYLPVTATLIPLPVHYHIHYGKPIPLQERYPPEAANDPRAVREAADLVRDAVQGLVDRGLAMRPGVFR